MSVECKFVSALILPPSESEDDFDSIISATAKRPVDLAKSTRKSKPKKQEPLPSLLERPKRKFKFEEEE
jgi:hypothetical protein